MIKKSLFLIPFLLAFSKSLFVCGQQLPIYQHSFLIRSAYNPAEILNKNSDLSVYLLRGDQFSRFDGGFENNYLNFSSPLRKKNIGLGLELASRSFGIINQLSASLTYGYKAKINKYTNVSFGLRLGFMEHKFNKSYLVVFQNQDPIIDNIPRGVVIPNGNFGTTLNTKFGSLELSVPQLLSNRFLNLSSNNNQNIILFPHLFSRYSVDIGIKNRNIQLTPIVSLRYLPSTIAQMEVGLTTTFNDIFWINLNYRSNYSAAIGAGLKLFDSWVIGFSHDRPIDNRFSFYNASNEFVLGYTFNKDKSRQQPVYTRDSGRYDYESARNRGKVKMDSISSVSNPEMARDFLKYQLGKMDLEDSLNNIANQKNRGEDYRSVFVQINLADSLFGNEISINKNSLNSQKISSKSENSLDDDGNLMAQNNKEKEEDRLIDELNENREEKIKIVRNTQPNEKVYVELSGEDSPRGYYLITGVFSTLERAQKFRWQDGSANSKIMINKKNNYFYVVQSFSSSKSIGDLKNIILDYQTKNKPIWILDY